MKKRVMVIILCAAVLLGIGAKIGYDWYDSNTYVTVAGEKLRRDLTELDCSGAPVAEPEKLKELTELRKLDVRNTGLTASQYETLLHCRSVRFCGPCPSGMGIWRWIRNLFL